MQMRKQEAQGKGRSARRGLVVGVIGAGSILGGLSIAWACTVGLHGGLLIAPNEAPTVSNDPISISVYSTLNSSLNPGPGSSSGLYIDPDYVDTSQGQQARQECLGADGDSSDDVRIGTVTYGEPAGQTPPDPSSSIDQYGYLYGEGSGEIHLADLTQDPNATASYGTYEICTGIEPQNHWDHFRIIDDS